MGQPPGNTSRTERAGALLEALATHREARRALLEQLGLPSSTATHSRRPVSTWWRSCSTEY